MRVRVRPGALCVGLRDLWQVSSPCGSLSCLANVWRCVCFMLISRPKVGGAMYASSAQPQPVKGPQLLFHSPSCLSLLLYNTTWVLILFVKKTRKKTVLVSVTLLVRLVLLLLIVVLLASPQLPSLILSNAYCFYCLYRWKRVPACNKSVWWECILYRHWRLIWVRLSGWILWWWSYMWRSACCNNRFLLWSKNIQRSGETT